MPPPPPPGSTHGVQVLPPHPSSPPPSRVGRALVTLLLLAGAGFALVKFGPILGLPLPGAPAAEGKDAPGKDGKDAKGGGKDNRPVPVLVAPATARDVPVVLEGLGNVAPLYTVTVRPQVDGKLEEVLFAEGQTVHKGDVIARIDPRPFTIALHAAEAVLARDTAQLKNAKVNMARYTQLGKEKLIADQQVTDQHATVDQLEAQLRIDQAAIDNAKLQLDYTRVTAPQDGVTGVRLTDPGNLVRAADATGLVQIAQVDPIAVLFTLPEDDLPLVQKGMAEGTLTVEAWSRDGTVKLGDGKLAMVDNQINQNTATARFKAVLPNPTHALWPNQFVKARLRVATRQGALVVPASAIQHGPKGTFVYVVGAETSAVVRPVTVDAMIGMDAVLLPDAPTGTGLHAGESVVVDGQSRLKPGAKVVPKTGDEPGRGKPGGGKPDGAKGRP